jgi:aldose 1-epimerase
LTHQTKPIEFLGEQAIQIENDLLAAILVPGLGSNIISLTYKKKSIAILRTPANFQNYKNSPILFGIPILFPPNRIEDGKFTFANRDYSFDINEPEKHNHIHGFVHDKPWKLISCDENSIVTKFTSQDYPEILRQFPHHFTLEMVTVLDKNRLIQRMTASNLSDFVMPIGLGYHTSFVFRENSEVQAQISKRWILNERNLPVGEFEHAEENLNVKLPLDDVFLVNSNSNRNSDLSDERLGISSNELTILDRENKIKLQYLCDNNFTQWVIYNRDGKSGFICPEPYTWVTNAPNLNLHNTLTGFQALKPGQSKTFMTEILVSDNEI